MTTTPPSDPIATDSSFFERLGRSRGIRIALPFVVIAILIAVAATVDLRPNLSHLTVHVLSGSTAGNYHGVVEKMRKTAALQHGTIVNEPSQGSVDNVARLIAATKTCEVDFALMQAGVPLPADVKLTFYGRFPKAESMFFLGKDADKIDGFVGLAGKSIAIGPAGSGTAQLVERLFAVRELSTLGVKLQNQPLDQQVDLAARGEVDLAAFVMDEDAALIQAAVRERNLQILHLPNADVIARRFPFLSHGRIGAGQYDAVSLIPPTDKRVFRVETWLVGNGCASRAQTLGVLRTLENAFPGFSAFNREHSSPPELFASAVAKSYFETGPDLLDEYLPRIANIMPTSNWVQVVMAVSVLFNFMGAVNRFRLWRIDAGRVRAELEIAACFGPSTTLGDIARTEPEGDLLRPALKQEIDRVIARLEQLAAKSRSYSLGIFCPMGGEMAYRYQESLMHEALAALRGFRERWEDAQAKVA